jgi:hypothetical protein
MLLRDVYVKAKDVFAHYTDKDSDWITSPDIDTVDILKTLYLPSAQEYFKKFPHHFQSTVLEQRTYPPMIHLATPPKGMISIDDFQELFSLEPYVNYIQKPFVWVHSKDDPLVNYHPVMWFNKMFTTQPFMGLFPTRHGGHIGFSAAFGKDWVLKIMVKYFTYWGKFPASYYLKWADTHVAKQFRY